MKKIIAWFCLAATLCFCLCGCSERLGVTSACVGYSVGNAENTLYNWHEEEERTLPAEFVRIFALYTALEGGAELTEAQQAAILFQYNAAAMKKVADAAGGREALLAEMNIVAAQNGLNDSVFGSLSGVQKAEEELASAEGMTVVFEPSRSTLKDLKKMAGQFAARADLAQLLSRLSYKFPGEVNARYRNAPVLRKDSDFYLENVRLYLGGSVLFADGNSEYIAVTVLDGGETMGISAVAERSGRDATEPFAACDGANLAGKAIGENYQFIHQPSEEIAGGGLAVGGGIFAVTIIAFISVLVLLLFAVIVTSIVTTAKRNAEGRKKYSSDKKEE